MKVIAYKNLPAHPPLGVTCVCWLLLDRFQVPGWAWGVYGCLVAIAWVAYGYHCHVMHQVNVFPPDPPSTVDKYGNPVDTGDRLGSAGTAADAYARWTRQ